MQTSSGTNLAFLKTIYPFHLLTDLELAEIAPLVERRAYSEGTVLFRYGELADFLYIIQSGTVKIQCKRKSVESDLEMLTEGELFGEEALGGDGTRQTAAVCTGRVILLRISSALLQQMADANPPLRDAFHLLFNSAGLNRRIDLPWRTPAEPVLLITRRHSFFLIARMVSLGVLALAAFSLLLYLSFTSKTMPVFLLFAAILALGVGLFFCAWSGVEWLNDYFIITRERVISQRQMIGFFEGRQESPLSAILSTGMDSTIWGRTIGFGTIVVRSYTGDLRMDKLPHPELIYGLLESRRQRNTVENRREVQARISEALNQRLHPEKTPVKPSNSRVHEEHSQGIYDSNSIGDLIARFFVLRDEFNGNIVYRTHWFILVKRTFLPALILVAVVGFVLARFTGTFNLVSESFVYSTALLASLLGWGWWIYRYIDWHNDVYIITSDQLVDMNRKPLGHEEKRSAPLKNIQTVEYKRNGLIGLLLNYGTVRIQIGNEELTFDNVYKPSSVQREVYAKFAAYNEKLKRNEQERLADWIQTYDRLNRTDRGKMDQNGVK